jgi:PKD domain
VTSRVRSFSLRNRPRGGIARCLALGLISLGGLLAAPLLAAAPAAAVVSGEFGVQERQNVPRDVEPLQYHGGPIVTASYTYAIYWDPADAYHFDWMTLIDRYFHDVGAESGALGNVFALDTQYTGAGGTRANYANTFRGAYTDTEPYPTSGCDEPARPGTCLTDAQIRKELQRFISENHLPTGVDFVYFILTPPGVTICTDGGGHGNCSASKTEKTEEEGGTPSEEPDGFCGYHSMIEPSSPDPIVYGVQPWVAGHAGHVERQLPLQTSEPTHSTLDCQNGEALVEPNQTAAENQFGGYETGLADVIINDLSVEQSDIFIDPLLNGWYQNSTGDEQSDMCEKAFSPAPEELPKTPKTTHALSLSNETINGDHYYLQWGFSSVGAISGEEITCWEGIAIDPHFTAANPVHQEDIIAVDANESDLTLAANVFGLPADEPFTAPIYKWEFGDGATVEGSEDASEFHHYEYGGVYPVTLTVTDSGGNSASYTASITVKGPPRPAPAPAPAPTGGSAGGAPAASTPASTTATTVKTAAPGPVASAAAASTSLPKATRSGLVVRYSVNQQVTGSFNVLLAASIAKRIGLHLPLALGLPAGTPPQEIVGKALLITTKGGHGTVKIQFGKVTGARLRRLGKVSLLLQLNLRNASGGTTTVLSKITLR